MLCVYVYVVFLLVDVCVRGCVLQEVSIILHSPALPASLQTLPSSRPPYALASRQSGQAHLPVNSIHREPQPWLPNQLQSQSALQPISFSGVLTSCCLALANACVISVLPGTVHTCSAIGSVLLLFPTWGEGGGDGFRLCLALSLCPVTPPPKRSQPLPVARSFNPVSERSQPQVDLWSLTPQADVWKPGRDDGLSSQTTASTTLSTPLWVGFFFFRKKSLHHWWVLDEDLTAVLYYIVLCSNILCFRLFCYPLPSFLLFNVWKN